MKRSAFLKHLARQGWTSRARAPGIPGRWHPEAGKRSGIPRHTEIADLLARKICADLGVKKP